jgi:hypothetical protein
VQNIHLHSGLGKLRIERVGGEGTVVLPRVVLQAQQGPPLATRQRCNTSCALDLTKRPF